MKSLSHTSLACAAAAFGLLVAGGCAPDSESPEVNYEANDRVYGEIAIAGENLVRSVSMAGPVTLEGEDTDVVRWYVYRYTSAPTQAEANAALQQVVPVYTKAGNTMVFDVTVPSSDGVTYHGAITLGVPSALACDVRNAQAPVRASNLSNDLTVQGSDSLTVLQHSGSVDVALSSGHILIEAAIPPSGSCTATTQSGDIELRLVPGTSATLVARALQGTVTVSGLELADRIDRTGFVSGTLGGGSAPIYLETRSGNITVKGL